MSSGDNRRLPNPWFAPPPTAHGPLRRKLRRGMDWPLDARQACASVRHPDLKDPAGGLRTEATAPGRSPGDIIARPTGGDFRSRPRRPASAGWERIGDWVLTLISYHFLPAFTGIYR